MFLAAWTSRCSAKPQQQTCWRCRKHFSTTWPQLLHRWLFACLEPAKERRKGFVQPPHGGLGTAEIQLGQPRIHRSLILEPGRLLPVRNRNLVFFVDRFPLPKASVVQAPMRLPHDFQLAFLVSVGIELKFISPSHLLPFLPFDVFPRRRLCHAADGGRELAAAPQSWQAGAEKIELLTQDVGGESLKRAAISATQRVGSDSTNR